MKIEIADLNYIQNVIKTADLVKIGNIAVEAGRIRGMDEARTAFILHTANVPDFAFGSIGLNRMAEFVARFNLARNATNFTMDATVETSGDSPFVRAIQMKGKGLKVDYRCANPLTIQAPKKLNDPFAYSFDIAPEVVTYLQQGQSAYRAENVTFIGTSDGVSMQLSDINNDKMEYVFADFCSILLEDDAPVEVKFTYNYPIKALLPLVKASPTAKMFINTKGVLRLNVNGLDVHIWAIQ